MLDVNSCPKKQNLVLRQSQELIEVIRLWIEKLLKTNRSAIIFRSVGRTSRETPIFDVPEVKKEGWSSVHGPVIERSDPQRIRLSNAFSRHKLDNQPPVHFVHNRTPIEWQRRFLGPMVQGHSAMFEFFKKTQLVGLVDPQHLVLQFESLLLLFEFSKLSGDIFFYKMMIYGQQEVTATVRCDLRDVLPRVLRHASDHGLLQLTEEFNIEQQIGIVTQRISEHEDLLSRLGIRIISEDLESTGHTILEVSRLKLLDRFGFYEHFWLLAVLKITEGQKTSSLDYDGWENALEVIWDYWTLNLNLKFEHVTLSVYQDHFEELLLELKQELVCSEVDITECIQPIVDLELTYKTFERC